MKRFFNFLPLFSLIFSSFLFAKTGEIAAATVGEAAKTGEIAAATVGEAAKIGEIAAATVGEAAKIGEIAAAIGGETAKTGEIAAATVGEAAKTGETAAATVGETAKTGEIAAATVGEAAKIGEIAAATVGKAAKTGEIAAATGGEAAKIGEIAAATVGETAKTGEIAAATGGEAAKIGEIAAATVGEAAKTGETAAATGGEAAKTGEIAAATGGEAAKTGEIAAATGGETAKTGETAAAIVGETAKTGEIAAAIVGEVAKTGEIAVATVGETAKTGETAAATVGEAAKTGEIAAAIVGKAAKTGETAVTTGGETAKTGEIAAATVGEAAKTGEIAAATVGETAKTGEIAAATVGEAAAVGDDSGNFALSDEKTSQESSEISEKSKRGFVFGSYGRAQPATDLQGGSPKWSNIAAHGGRLEQSSYVEFDFVYLFEKGREGAPLFDFVSTLAFSNSLFHESGSWAVLNAIRNLFVRVENMIWKPLGVWVGSRMYRGDDIYLLDFWPLDDANMYGGGIGLHFEEWSLDYYIGFNRLEVDWQYQEREVVSDAFGSESVAWMDRQRLLTGLKYEQKRHVSDKFAMKWKILGEFQRIGSGKQSKDPVDEENFILYPEDFGWSVGAQLGFFDYAPNSFTNIFFKYSGGLAAYGLLNAPWGFDVDYKTLDAQELTFAFSSNLEIGWFGAIFGGYVRSFRDSDGNRYDNDDFTEYVVSVRPHFFIHEHFYLAFEISHQLKNTNGLTRLNDGNEKNILPQVTKFSLIPIVAYGGGNYGRPQLRLVYTLAFQNDDARYSYDKNDFRSKHSLLHYFGLSAEWQFNVGYR